MNDYEKARIGDVRRSVDHIIEKFETIADSLQESEPVAAMAVSYMLTQIGGVSDDLKKLQEEGR